ncbi:PREDICTED: cyclin-D3-3-like [Fragaria vesca subsp. vesca]|uniref:cyclin-D3-3-like n=1 Tax=Fragaria vesca subsp. vesca TaxID=101020 RepID=UPI0002C2DF5C|nr:PREDICTED: cyclin-D3-3-like [Fragaria vesca subsp. vesca]
MKKMDQPFLLDALFCSEQHLDEEEEEVLDYEFVEDSSLYSNTTSTSFMQTQIKSPILLEQDLFWDDEELASLLAKEKVNQDRKIKNPSESLARARKEAVDWMLRVNTHYSFSALTAVLAVDYLDRCFSRFQFQPEKPWMTQLAAVACLSVAAKVEETQVPLLLDLQVEDSKYVFEAKNISRMEIMVLSTLDWRMNPVTPISFLDYMTRRFGLKDHLCWEFLKRCELILVNLISDSRFLSFLPSVAATATMLHVVNNIEPCLQVEYENQLLSILGIDKGAVDDCSKLIMELSSSWSRNKRKFGSSIPGSPNGVIDISFSSDSSNDSWAVASSVSSSPEPLSKKSRALEKQLLEKLNHTANATADILSLPRLP